MYKWEQSAYEGQIFLLSKPMLLALLLPHRWEGEPVPCTKTKNAQSHLSQGPGAADRAHFWCVLAQSRAGAWNCSLTSKSTLCQSPSITELSLARVPWKNLNLWHLFRIEANRHPSHLLRVFVHPGPISCKKDQKCPPSRWGMTPSHSPCPRQTDRQITWPRR